MVVNTKIGSLRRAVLNEWVTCNRLITGQGSQFNGFNHFAPDRVGSLRHFKACCSLNFLMVVSGIRRGEQSRLAL
jgi:hypothetical protein